MNHRYTVRVNPYGAVTYLKDDKLHRDGDKPAWISATGYVSYWKNGHAYYPSIKKYC